MESRLRTIVVGVAELDKEEYQLGRAMELAESLDATLYVVHAFHVPDPTLYPYPEMSLFSPEAIDSIERGVQERLERLAGELSSTDRVISRAVPAPGETAVLEVAEEVNADLIIIGATRRGKLGKAVLGTTAQRIIRTAHVPVLVVRAGGRSTIGRVLMTTDLSALSRNAQLRGLQIAGSLGDSAALEVRSLLVVAYDMPLPPPLDEHAATELAEMKLAGFLERMPPDLVPVAGKVRIGNPAEEIVAEATEWEADLLVLGTHGRTGASRFLIGSVAESVLKSAPCDVLVVPNAGGPGAAENPGKDSL